MPVPEYYSPERVRKAAEAVREETQRTSGFSDRARRSLFNRAADAGLLDDALDEFAEEWNENPLDMNIRDYQSADDYPNYIPYSSSIDIDPDEEIYTSYRLAGQDPKVRQYLSDPANRSSSTSPELLDQVFRDIAEGRVNPNDLNDLRSSFESEILTGAAPTAAEWEAANYIEGEGNAPPPLSAAERLSPQRAIQSATPGMGVLVFEAQPRGSRQLDPDIYSGFSRLEEDLLAATPIARTALETETSRVGVQQALNRRLNELDVTGGGLFQDDARRRLADLASRIPPDVVPTTRQEAIDTRNLLYNLQQDLNTFNVRDPFRVDLTSQRMAETVLPSVRDALGADRSERAAYEAMRNRLNEQNQELRLQQGDSVRANNQEAMRMRRGEQRVRIEAEMARMDERARNPVDINTRSLSPTFSFAGQARQEPISGLVENIEQIQNEARLGRGQEKLEHLRNVLADYPEVEKLLTAPPRKGAPQRIKGEEFKPYMQYADTTQQASMPADRAALYDKIIGRYDDLDLENMTRDTLNRAEKLYTSGSTEAQTEARALIQALADNNELQQIEKPAFRAGRPLVGGGDYVNPRDSQQNLFDLRNYIDQRSSRINNALTAAEVAMGPELLKAEYPGLANPKGGPLQAAFKFDPATREVTESDVFDRDTYRVRVSPAGGGQFELLNSRALPMRNDQVSLNALRFLRDNPVADIGTIAFDTAKPGEDYSGYSAQTDLPSEVTQRFHQFIKQAGLERARPGTLVTNAPKGSYDLFNQRISAGETAETSSTVRKLQPYYDKGQEMPNVRGVAYGDAGFGPVLQEGSQYGYVDAQGKVVPLQLTPTEFALRGQVRVPQVGPSVVRQDVLPLASTPRYYLGDPITALVPGAMEFGQAIRRTPAALLPGAVDLIPSPEAIATGYREGLPAMGRQMATEFTQSLPVSAAAAGVLSTPVVAPATALFGPGVAAGFAGVAGTRALNEVVRQQTGEGIVPKLRQAWGTEPRTGVADSNRARPLGVSGQPARVVPTREINPILREFQNRLGLAGARFNPAKGEFGLSELFGFSR
jgi:hypothetical protein